MLKVAGDAIKADDKALKLTRGCERVTVMR